MTPRPSALARAGVALATRLLPPEARSRYREEFLAELHGLPPAARLSHLAGVIVHAPALRAALEEDAMTMPMRARGPFWRCRVLRWHRFVVRSGPDGDRYQVCARCGTDRGPVGYGPLTTPPWPIGSAGA